MRSFFLRFIPGLLTVFMGLSSAYGDSVAVDALRGTEQQINGHFMHYGSGPYDWAYYTADGSLLAKLEGMDAQTGYLNWKILDHTTFDKINSTSPYYAITFGSTASGDAVIKALAGKTQPVDGHFMHYGAGAYDWAYITADGSLLAKLTGMEPATGYLTWEVLDKNAFDWVIIAPDAQSVNFGKNTLPAGSFTYPASGEVVARYDYSADSDYIEIAVTNTDTLSDIRGMEDGITFDASYGDNGLSRLIYGDLTLDVSYGAGASFTFLLSGTGAPPLRATQIDCTTSKADYQAQLAETEEAITVMVLYMTHVYSVYERNNMGGLSEKEYHSIFIMMGNILAADKEYGYPLMRKQHDLETLLADYDTVCSEPSGSCSGEYEIAIDTGCLNYYSDLLATQDEINAVVESAVNPCPMTRPDSGILGCNYYSDTDTLFSYYPYTNGRIEGTVIFYNRNGLPTMYAQYENNQNHGLILDYDGNSLVGIDRFDSGTRILETTYKSNGTFYYVDTSTTDYSFRFDFGENVVLEKYTEKYLVQGGYTKVVWFDNGEMVECDYYQNGVYSSCMP